MLYEHQIFTTATRVLSTRTICINNNYKPLLQFAASSCWRIATTARGAQNKTLKSTVNCYSSSAFGTNDWSDHHNNSATTHTSPSLRIPSHAAHKVCTASDAVSLISRGDTIA